MATPSAHSHILLKDKGKKYPRGVLVKLGSDGAYLHSHGCFFLEDRISLSCGDVAPLTKEECHILDAIDSAADRYAVYSTPGKLAWGVGLKVDDTVLAKLPPKNGQGSSGDGEQQAIYTTAIIRWCGDIEKIGPIRVFGVEITVCIPHWLAIHVWRLVAWGHSCS